MQKLPAPGVGDEVVVRNARWRVAQTTPFDDCAIVQLAGTGRTNHGRSRHLLWPFDRFVLEAPRHEPVHSSAGRWRRRLRHLIADHGPVSCLRGAYTARIDLLDYQLAPAMALANGATSRLLIADDVGLGKTVQAGLAIAELVARDLADRILVLCPSGLRDQWLDELASRLSLPFRIVDASSLARRRAELPLGVNPWTTERFAVASMDLVKRADVLAAVLEPRWDLIVVDEAHHATSRSDRGKAIGALCARAPHVILLTATPHNGDARAYATLCDLGARDDRLLVFRRTRADVGLATRRRVHLLSVRQSRAERRMHALLSSFERVVRLDRAGRTAEAMLTMSVLRKRALSSPHALWLSVERRLAMLRGKPDSGPSQLRLPLDDADAVESADAAPMWSTPVLSDSGTERDWLVALSAAAARALHDERKVRALRRILRRAREPVLVFTEYRDTALHLRDAAAPSARLIHGGLTDSERRQTIADFKARGGVLLATDAAGEGLNLQDRCRIVVNMELPWNPSRLEQRIGRVDRIGQTKRVHAFHFVARGTAEARVLQRLRERLSMAKTAARASSPLDDSNDAPAATQEADVAQETALECSRLRRARAMCRGEQVSLSPQGAPWILRTRRTETRRWLNGRALLVLQSALVEAQGATIARLVIPLMIPAGSGVEACHSEASALLASCIQHWRRESTTAHESYWTTRLARERLIAAALGDCLHREIQPGLFDRRALRQADADRTAIEQRMRDLERRLAALENRAAPLRLDGPRPALLMEASHGPWCDWTTDFARDA